MTKRAYAGPYDGPTMLGVDLSHHNHDEVLIGLETTPEFAFIRYADGTTVDRKVDYWVSYCEENDIPWDLYLYVRAYHGAEAQIEPLLEYRQRKGGGHMFPALDVEDGQNSGAWYQPDSPLELDNDVVVDCLDGLEADCHRETGGCIVYGGQALHWRLFQHPLPGDKYRPLPETLLWTPSPGTGTPRLPVHPNWYGFKDEGGWTFWQHTWRLEGRALDGNLFRGDRARFVDLFGRNPGALIVTDTDKASGVVTMQSELSIKKRFAELERRIAVLEGK